MNNPRQEDNEENNGPSLVELGTTVGDLLSGTTVPTPIRRSFFKAISQLCSAGLEIPIAYLEGIAAEKRAESNARVNIINTTGNHIASQLSTNSEYASVASKKYAEKILREQTNLDRISMVAVNQIGDAIPALCEAQGTQCNAPEINQDWLNSFEAEACQKSTEEMQILFGRILAGEILRPSTFSIKTVKLLGELSQDIANTFRRLCSHSISLGYPGAVYDSRVLSLGGNAAANCLQSYGFNFGTLNLLQEHGLIISDYHSYMNYRGAILNPGQGVAPIKYQNKLFALTSLSESINQDLNFHGVALTKSGRELLGIVDMELTEEYTSALSSFLKKQNISLRELHLE